jgi:hypothetical protein
MMATTIMISTSVKAALSPLFIFIVNLSSFRGVDEAAGCLLLVHYVSTYCLLLTAI